METTTDVWMIEQHLCRCCHSEGKFKSLISTDNLMEDELLYLDALRFCLDVELCLVEGPLAYAACTICEACVARLQEACSFRRQVLSCEGRFQTLYSQNRIKVASSEPVVKEELSEPDDSYSEDNHDMDSLYIKEEKNKEMRKKPKSPCVSTKRTASAGDRDIQREARKKEFQVLDSDYKRVQKNKFTCTRCSKTLRSLYSIRYHIRSRHLAENKYHCTLCNASFRTHMPLVKHKFDEHNIDDRFRCNGCDGMFHSKSRLNLHVKRFRVGEKCKCPPKPPRVSTKRSRSLTAPAGDRDIKRDSYSEDNHDMDSMYIKEEKPKENRKKPKPPRVSTKRGGSRTVPRDIQGLENIRRHLFRFRDSDYELTGDKFICTRCSKTFNTKETLRYHIKYHHLDITPFKCTVCNTSFRSNIQLVKHKLEKHNIDDRFKCNACDKMFNTKLQLNSHKNIFHMLGEKLKCQQCDYESYSLHTMNRHKIKHKTVKDYHCKYCKKSFLRRTTLQFHERIHTGDKRKVCAECGQAFVQKASLNYHMMKYHPAVKY